MILCSLFSEYCELWWVVRSRLYIHCKLILLSWFELSVALFLFGQNNLLRDKLSQKIWFDITFFFALYIYVPCHQLSKRHVILTNIQQLQTAILTEPMDTIFDQRDFFGNGSGFSRKKLRKVSAPIKVYIYFYRIVYSECGNKIISLLME